MKGGAVSLDVLRRQVRRAVGGPKRDMLLAALAHPDLVRARRTTGGLLLEGPGGIVSTHLSCGEHKPRPLQRDLRRVGLLE